MPRKAQFPPRPHVRRGQEVVRLHFAGRALDYPLGPPGSPEAHREYARILRHLTESPGVPPPRKSELRQPQPGGVTVGEVVLRWLSRELPRLDPRGREPDSYRRVLTVLTRVAGDLPAAAFDADALDGVRFAMMTGSWMTDTERAEYASRKQPVGWCANVCNRNVVRIRTVWRWAERAKLVPAGSWGHLRSLPGLAANDRRARHTEPVKPAEWDDVRAVCRRLGPVPRAMLLVQWWTGMRSAEVRTMRVGDVDTTGDVWVYRPRRHKMQHRGQSREVQLGPKARAALAPWLRLASASGPDTLVFRSNRGTEYSRRGYCQVIRVGAQRVGLRLHGYQCRHAARLRVSREMGLEAARAMLGHASLGTTLGYAAGTDARLAADVARRLG